jgi:NAD(P)-dependent dehydrogenase (short-subunit alcohol dehydrogenase family)
MLFDSADDRVQQTLAAIEADGGEAVTVVGDVTDRGACAGAVAAATDRWGRLDVLVNNAAVVDRAVNPEARDEEWDRVMTVNLKAPMMMSNVAAPAMAATGGGSIINVSSIAGIRAFGASAYGASKAGLNGLTRDLALQLGRQAIRVNAIAPGHLHSPMGYSNEANRDLRRQASLLGTEGTAWDVAWACVFLASDEARWITGVVLPVDAGATAVTAMAMHGYMGTGSR